MGFMLDRWEQTQAGTTVRATAHDMVPSEPLTIYLQNTEYHTQGICVQYEARSTDDGAFVALVDPATLVGYDGAGTSFCPARLSFDGVVGGFTYDVFGLPEECYPSDQPLFVTGRIRGADVLQVSFDGVIDDIDYTYRGVAMADATHIAGALVSRLWAFDKVTSLGTAGTATQLSIDSHILTPYTALLALEPGMEEAIAGSDENQGAVSLGVESTKAHGTKASASLALSRQANIITIGLSGIGNPSTCLLRIYDLTGRMVADLTSQLRQGRQVVSWNTARVPTGTYVVHLVVEGTLVTKRVSVTR
jgi:hypothetical protein